MCGLLCVKSRHPIPLDQHLGALATMHDRGPDFQVWRYHNGIFMGQTVLHFSGSTDVYHGHSKNMLVFNGEIYDWSDHGPWDSDTRLIWHTVQNRDWQRMKRLDGPWAWIWTDFHSVEFATDAQHERHLWHYQDHDIMIVASEIQAIAHYVDLKLTLEPWASKHLPIREHTPWAGVTRVRPGFLYRDGQLSHDIVTMADWAHETQAFTGTFQEAVEELDHIMTMVCRDINRSGPVSLSLSGGLDSSLLATYFEIDDPVTVIMGDKDPVAASLPGHLIDPEHWARAYHHVVDRLRLPPLSWSWVSFALVAGFSRHRAIVSGTGADELFGGYSHNLTGQPSPYHAGHAFRLIADARQNSLVLDYIIHSGGVDLLGLDLVAGLFGREARAPFAHGRVIRFALSLPYHYKVGDQTKEILRSLYQRRTGRPYLRAKQGFAGHCNDSIAYIRPDYHTVSTDRHQAWKDFVYHDFVQRFQSADQDA